MICYRDMTFCTAKCFTECARKLTEEVRLDAVKWWGNEDAPIAVADFSPSCEMYRGEK